MIDNVEKEDEQEMPCNRIPFFSVIIPTRSRPELVNYALQSLHTQTFDDFEVVISDDYLTVSCKSVVDNFKDDRFKYYHPDRNIMLSMSDNWRYGLDHAQGKYIIFIQDKMFFYHNSLKEIYDSIIDNDYPDSVNWSWDFYSFFDQRISPKGFLFYYRKSGRLTNKSIDEAIESKLSFKKFDFHNEKGAPGEGSPLCSAIKRETYELADERFGDVFKFINPDYGPCILLLSCMKKLITLEDNQTVLVQQAISEGATHNNVGSLRKFILRNKFGLNRMRYATVPRMLATDANVISAEYNYTLTELGMVEKYKECAPVNTLLTIYNELNRGEFSDVEDKNTCYMQFNEAYDKLDGLQKDQFNEKIQKQKNDNRIRYGSIRNKIKLIINNKCFGKMKFMIYSTVVNLKPSSIVAYKKCVNVEDAFYMKKCVK